MSQFPFQTFGKILIIIGGILLIAGVILLISGKIPFFGKLPGDITLRGKSYSVFIPLTTCLILSVLLTIILNFLFRK